MSAASSSRSEAEDYIREMVVRVTRLENESDVDMLGIPSTSQERANLGIEGGSVRGDSDEDARSEMSYQSSSSVRSRRPTAKKIKQNDSEEGKTRRKRAYGDNTDAEEFKSPDTSSPPRIKVLGLPPIVVKTEEELDSMTIEDLRKTAVTWLDHIDDAKRSSGNLQGRIIKIMRDRVKDIKGIIDCLAGKAEIKGDPLFYKIQNAKLEARKCLEKEESQWMSEKKKLELEIAALGEKNEEAETQIWHMSRNVPMKIQDESAKVKGKLTEHPNKEIASKVVPMSKKEVEQMDKDWPVLRPP